jgi:hypothetical protein
MLAIVTSTILISCNYSGGSSKSVDIPPYAIGEGAYFADRETKTAHVWYGKADINYGTKKFGRYTDGGLLSGMHIEMNGEQFVMLQTKSNLSLTKYLFEDQDEYSVQLIWYEFNLFGLNSPKLCFEKKNDFQIIPRQLCCEVVYFRKPT